MTAITAIAAPLINTTALPGVASVEEDSIDGKPAMKIVFVDGVEATVARAFVDNSKFDIWLPPEQPYMAASVMAQVDKKTVLAMLNELAAKAVDTI